MHDLNLLLQDMGLIFFMAVGVLLVCFRLKIPAVIGFLLTGMLAGPAGLGLVKDIHVVEMMAEIGIVLLLFTIGIEFSLRELWQLRKPVFMGGGVQVIGCIVLGALLMVGLGFAFQFSLFIGFLFTLSSTAIVLKLLQERAEMSAPQGRLSLALLIFQDVMAIPMMLLVPLLAGVQSSGQTAWGAVALKFLGVMALIVVSARYIIPWILNQVVATRIRELFLITVVGICLVIAGLSSALGLSLALGAFIAGLIISESEYSHQAMSYIMPFRDVFTSLFFVSTGMLLGYQDVIKNFSVLLWLFPLVFVVKTAVIVLAGKSVGYSLRVSLMTGLMLCQIGEFSLIIAKIGNQYKLLNADQYALFLALALLSMIFTPVAFWLASLCVRWIPGPQPSASLVDSSEQPELIIVGYGIGGRQLAEAATLAEIPHQILEMNIHTVQQVQPTGVPIHYGDATRAEVLHHAGLYQARVLAIMISDAAATRRVVELARRECPQLWIVVRTRFVHEIDALYDLGASDVIAEEFEASIEVFSQVLNHFLVPYTDIQRLSHRLRSAHYREFRQQQKEHLQGLELRLPGVKLFSAIVNTESELVGKTLEDSDLRQRFEVTVLSVERNQVSTVQPEPRWQFAVGDMLLCLGSPESEADVKAFLTPSAPQ